MAKQSKKKKEELEDKVKLVGKLLHELGVSIPVNELMQYAQMDDADKYTTTLHSFPLKKRRFILAYIDSLGVVSQAARAANIWRKTYYNWRDNDPIFKQFIDDLEIHQVKKDFYEEGYNQLVRDRHPYAIIRGNQMINKDRGYMIENEPPPPPDTEEAPLIYIPDNGRDPDANPKIIDIDHEEPQKQIGKSTDE